MEDHFYEGWEDKAACRRYPLPAFASWWFPPEKNNMPSKARNVCRGCPVIEQCEIKIMKREGMSDTGSREGNQAKMTPFERRRLAKSRMEKGVMPWEPVTDCPCGCGKQVKEYYRPD